MNADSNGDGVLRRRQSAFKVWRRFSSETLLRGDESCRVWRDQLCCDRREEGGSWRKIKTTLVSHCKVKEKKNSPFFSCLTSDDHTCSHSHPCPPLPASKANTSKLRTPRFLPGLFWGSIKSCVRSADFWIILTLFSCDRGVRGEQGWVREGLIPEKTWRFCVTDDVKQTTEAFSVPVCNPFHAISTVVARRPRWSTVQPFLG